MLQGKNKAVFLDRDGTINKDSSYVYQIEKLEFLPNVVDALRIFQKEDFLLFVVSNQSGVGRGFFTEEDVTIFNKTLKERLQKRGIVIEKFYICLHSPEENCICRKPLPYMINKAIEEYNIDMSRSFMFGDKETDVTCGKNAQIQSFLVTKDKSLYSWAKELKANNFEI